MNLVLFACLSLLSDDVITGVVLDSQGEVCAGAIIHAFSDRVEESLWLVSDSQIIHAMTNDRGRFEVGTPERALFNIVVVSEGHSPHVEWSVEPGSEVNVKLRPSRIAKGLVADEKGTPIEGATLTYRTFLGGAVFEKEATSDKEGQWMMGSFPGIGFEFPFWFMSVCADGYCRVDLEMANHNQPQGLVLNEADVYEQNFVLSKGGTIRGQILDKDSGTPISNAKVVLWWKGESSGYGLKPYRVIIAENPLMPSVLDTALTDQEGFFRIENAPLQDFHNPHSTPRNRQFELFAFASGFGAARKDVKRASSDDVQDMTLELPSRARITGTVVDKVGKAVPNIDVLLSVPSRSYEVPPLDDAQSHRLRVNTDADGGFDFEHVPLAQEGPNVLTLYVRRESETSVEVQAGETIRKEIVIDTTPSRRPITARLRAVDEDKNPIYGAAIFKLGSGEAGNESAPLTEEDGWANLRFTEDRLALEIRRPGYAVHTTEFLSLDSADPPEYEITLEEEHTLRGRIVDEDGNPVDGATVNVMRLSQSASQASDSFARRQGAQEGKLMVLSSAWTRWDGSFVCHYLPKGPYGVSVEGRIPEQGSITKVIARAEDLTTLKLKSVPESKGSRVILKAYDDETGAPIPSFSGFLKTSPNAETRPQVVQGERGSVRSVARENVIRGRQIFPGQLLFEEVPNGIWHADLRPNGYPRLDSGAIQVPLDDEASDIEFFLTRGATVHGRITEADGVNIDGLSLFFRHQSLDAVISTIPDSDGAFSVQGFGPGRWQASLNSEDPFGDRREPLAFSKLSWIEIKEDTESVEFNAMAIDPGSIRVFLRLPPLRNGRTEDDDPVVFVFGLEGVEAVQTSRGGSYSAKTRSRHFDFVVPPGGYEIIIKVDGEVVETERIQVEKAIETKREWDFLEGEDG